MNRTASVPWKKIRERMVREDSEFASELEDLAPEYEIARQLLHARLERGLSQEELAARIGTRQSNISRIEHGQQNISIGTLNKVAKGLGKKLRVSVTDR